MRICSKWKFGEKTRTTKRIKTRQKTAKLTTRKFPVTDPLSRSGEHVAPIRMSEIYSKHSQIIKDLYTRHSQNRFNKYTQYIVKTYSTCILTHTQSILIIYPKYIQQLFKTVSNILNIKSNYVQRMLKISSKRIQNILQICSKHTHNAF